MIDIKYEEVIQGESKTLVVNVILEKKINFDVVIGTNESGELCAYVDRQINNQIINYLNMTNPSFGFMANMFLQMYQPIEVKYDFATGKFLEVTVNSSPYDVSYFNNKVAQTQYTSSVESLKDLILKVDPVRINEMVGTSGSSDLDNFYSMDDEEKKILDMLVGKNEQEQEQPDDSDTNSSNSDETDENELYINDSSDSESESESESEEDTKESEPVSTQNKIKRQLTDPDLSNLSGLMGGIDPNMLTSLIGGLGGMMGTNKSTQTQTKSDTPQNMLSNIKNMWTNEYYDTQEQEDLDDFLVKDDNQEDNQVDSKEDNKVNSQVEDKSKTEEEELDNEVIDELGEELGEELDDESEPVQMDKIFQSMFGGVSNTNSKTKYLNRKYEETALELVLKVTPEFVESQKELVKKITTPEQFTELIEEYKKISETGTVKSIDSPLDGKNIETNQEVRTREDGSEYIYSKFNYMGKKVEIELDYLTVCKYAELYVKILEFGCKKLN